jgi:Methyl-CpG binding domain
MSLIDATAEKATKKKEKAKKEETKGDKKKPKAAAKKPEKTAAKTKTAAKKAASPKQAKKKESATPGRGPSAVEVYSGEPNEPLEGGWPPGWTKKIFERPSGATKGTHDRYWYTPITKRKLRSMIEVNRFLAALGESNGDEDEAWKIFKSK